MVDSKHLKRYAAPRSWAIERKSKVWSIRPQPGAHPMEKSIPLLVVLRDILNLGDTASEIRKILAKRDVFVDGRVRTSPKLPVGVMDIISIPRIKSHYRVLVNPRGQITLRKIEESESKWKLAKIVNKTLVTGGKLQLNLHDGRNILVDKDVYKTGDAIKISLPDQKIIETFPMKEESLAILTGGAHIGTVCRIKRIEITRNPDPNIVEFHEGFNTIIDHVFIVGTKTSEIESAEVTTI
jgi:small subunit ribosomal protein S4e